MPPANWQEGEPMAQEPTDEELRTMIRALSRTVGIPLSEEWIVIVLPAYRGLLNNAHLVMEVEVPIEEEPALVYDLARGSP